MHYQVVSADVVLFWTLHVGASNSLRSQCQFLVDVLCVFGIPFLV